MTHGTPRKNPARRAIIAGAAMAAVVLASISGLGSQGQQPAAATTFTFSPASVSCSEDFVGGLFFATDNDPNPPGDCSSSAAAVGGSPDGIFANVETDDSAEGDTAMGDDDLVVRFDLSALTAGYRIASATLKVWSTPSNDPGLLKAGFASSGDADSMYGAVAPGPSPANYSNFKLAQAAQQARPGVFEVNLSMSCVGPSDDCGALVDAAQLEVTLADGTVSSITKADDGVGVYHRGETFNWTITFEVTGGFLATDKTYVDTLPLQFSLGHVSFAGTNTNFECYALTARSVECYFAAWIGIPPGRYSATVSVTVKSDAACGTVVNDVYDWPINQSRGPLVASDAVEISCGTETATPPAPTVPATATTSPAATVTTTQTVIATATPTPSTTANPSSTSTAAPNGTATPTSSFTATATSTPTRTATPTPTTPSTAGMKYKLRTMQVAHDGPN